MAGVWMIAGGVLSISLALIVAMNTSMGGTRSDHDDGSGFIAGAGLFFIVAGAAVSLVEIFA